MLFGSFAPNTFALVPMALAIVLSLVWLIQFAVRSGRLRIPRAAPSHSQLLTLVQVLPIDARRRLHLVRCQERHVLILSGGAQDLVVGWLPGTEL